MALSNHVTHYGPRSDIPYYKLSNTTIERTPQPQHGDALGQLCGSRRVNHHQYRVEICLTFSVFSIRAGSRRISPSIAVFFPAILFPTKIDRYFSGTSCTCFGIVFILVPYLIVCALARFSDLKRETSHYSI